ncbi:acetylornithine aminotransferase 2 [Thalassobaculum fulvum]|uniref:Acetylornithine aminotransferase n=1 Tax=Thalassobaculum fulvum TaxID=1633335 RepID=A0A919CSP5_9PROT|nr:acetylornithine transaminase [Thalassobaculum fulvum]GHD63340.1 acetylornithine aminotransferase 2 [Thalassobaculum fulvum]
MSIPQSPFAALMDIAPRPPVVFADGQGSWLYDTQGKRYLDLVQGWAVTCLGHSPAPVVKALTEQAARLINCSPAYHNEQAVKLAQALTRASGLDQAFFANSGAEANEGAIKLARKWGEKHRGGAYEIVTTVNGFHGRTLATMSASGKPAWKTLFEPKVPGFPKVPLGDIAAVEGAITDRTVAVMLEPIQGEAGVIPAGIEYLKALRELTEKRGILLILDEIQTGMGRTGSLFAFEQAGIRPDVMTLGKGLGGGVPLAALLARREVCCFEYGDQGGTFNGNPLMCAVGSAVLAEITAPGFLDRVQAAGARLWKGLETLAVRHGYGAVRGQGLLLALDLKKPVGPAIVEQALADGLLLNAPRPDTLRFMPALTISDTEIAQAMTMLDGVCGKVGG